MAVIEVQHVNGYTPQRQELISESSPTVLLVEDCPALRVLYRIFLTACGYSVLEAGDGEEALQCARRYTGDIDLLLTDVSLPKIDGRKLGNMLTEQRPELKVLFVSGYGEDTMLEIGALKDRSAFLQKPFLEEELMRTVRGLLET